MEEKHRTIIRRNFKTLIDNTDLDQLLPIVIEKEIFPSVEDFTVSSRSKDTKRKFYIEIQSRGPDAFNLLLESLLKSGHRNLHKLLSTLNGNEPSNGTIDEIDRESSCQIRAQAVPFQLSDDFSYDHVKDYVANGDVDAALNLNTQPLVINVKKSDKFYDKTLYSSLLPYSTRSKHRGLLFLVNNYDFGNIKKTRRGSEVDQKSLIALFEQMNFKVEAFENQTYTDMTLKLKYIKNHPDIHKIDCLFTIIMSHGEEGETPGSNNIITVDGKTISTSEVISAFNNIQCLALRGKPKVFVFQFCRGGHKDHGTQDSCHIQTDSQRNKKMSSVGDILICHSTLSGFISHRDIFTGSWYIQTMCNVFMEYAHDTDVATLFETIAAKIEKFRSESGTLQTTAFENIHFRKLFLHPGIYEEDNQIKHFQ